MFIVAKPDQQNRMPFWDRIGAHIESCDIPDIITNQSIFFAPKKSSIIQESLLLQI